MKYIYKYLLAITDDQIISIPKDSTVLSVICQNNQLVVYVVIDTDNIESNELYKFKIIGTGNPIVAKDFLTYRFLNTVSMADGNLIWHVFYRKA